jgi:hypothetical protein
MFDAADVRSSFTVGEVAHDLLVQVHTALALDLCGSSPFPERIHLHVK